MTEEWLERLANQIKENERKGAQEAARTRTRIQLLVRNGPVFWKSFSEALHKNVMDLRNLLEGDVTLAEGPLSFDVNASTLQISFAKAAFPTVQFMATPRFDQERADITYFPVGPRSEASSMACELEVDYNGRVTMRLEGRPFTNPTDAATFVMERVFRVPALRRVQSQDSHLGRVGSE